MRKFPTDLSNAKHNDAKLKRALKPAKRCHKKVLPNDLSEVDKPTKIRFCEVGAEGKSKALKVRETMFNWLVAVRERN